MGDYFQNIVAPEVPCGQAEAEAHRMLTWLIADGIVSADKKDCVLGAEFGYPPGPNYVTATEANDPHLMNLRTGVTEIAGQFLIIQC